jgi:hypothetical protein
VKRVFSGVWRALLPAFIAAVSGCASITGSELQSISVQALDQAGAPVAGSECRLSNDKGNWSVKPPTVAVVNRSAEDLHVRCEAEGQEPGMARAISRANAGMFGNIIFGGGVGALIDHSKGTAYDYPSAIRVVFGTAQVIDKQHERGGAPPEPPAPVPPSQSAEAPRSPSDRPASLDDLKDLLPKD